MARLGRGILWAILGYVSGALLVYALVMLVSSNTHDRALEAGMTGAFIGGPLCAIVAFVMGLLRRPRATG